MSNPLTAEDIRVGGVYRGKRPRRYVGGLNDRTVTFAMPQANRVFYTSTALHHRSYASASFERFLHWADYEVKDEQPANG